MSKKFYVTTPIYYVNDKPHIGHAYTTLAADVLARFKRLDGYDVKFLTGTDEHGQKIEKAAAEAGIAPQAFVDKVSANFRALADVMGFSHDDFIRTTEPRHYTAVKALWEKIAANGYIYQGTYAGWYAVRDEAYYAESELVDGKAPSGADVQWVEAPTYFFKLSAFQEPLLAYFRDHPDFIGPDSRRNEVLRFVEGGLRDLSISRDTLKWGIPVPGDDGHVVYVWMDALTNYITALGYPNWDKDGEAMWGEALHLVGKDILRFHTVYWPAFLMAAGLPLPKRIYAHGWWTNEGQKISKSLGNAIDPLALVDKYGLDAVRYFLMREVPFGQDGDFSIAAFEGRYQADLANNLGNLVQRVASFIVKNVDGVIPTPGTYTDADTAILKQASQLYETLLPLIDKQNLHLYLERVWALAGEANRYIDVEKPWSLRKDDPARMATVLYVLLEVIRTLGLFIQPVMPEAAGRILDVIGVPLNQRSFADRDVRLSPGSAMGTPAPLFPRREAA